MSWYAPLSMLNVAEVYLAAPYLWDFFIYLTLFLGVSTFVFTSQKHFGKKGKPVAIAVGVALALSLTIWTYQNGWSLGSAQVATLPLLLLSLILFYLLYKLLTDLFEMSQSCAFAIAYLFTYTGVYSIYESPLRQALMRYEFVELLLFVVTIVVVFILFKCLFSLFGKRPDSPPDSAPLDSTPSPRPTPGPTPTPPPPGPHPLTSPIRQFVLLTADLDEVLRDYRQGLNKVLAANHQAHNNPAPAHILQRDDAIADLRKPYGEVAQILHEVQQLSRAIATQPNLSGVPREELDKLATAYGKCFSFARDASQLRTQFKTKFRNNEDGPL